MYTDNELPWYRAGYEVKLYFFPNGLCTQCTYFRYIGHHFMSYRSLNVKVFILILDSVTEVW